MSELVEKFAEKWAKIAVTDANVKSVKNLMDNMKISLEQALDAMGINGDERDLIKQQLQK